MNGDQFTTERQTICTLPRGWNVTGLSLSTPLPSDNEPAWSKYLAAKLGGVAEYRTIDNSRCDVLTDDYAIEVEWVKKWKESIGQSLLYAELTGRRPKVILLLRGHDHERLYVDRCRMVCCRAGITLETVSTVDRSENPS
tara:strand:- start:18886 stop:19305 length:420 start_codon:yes stop_codon:yes gene_type:complete